MAAHPRQPQEEASTSASTRSLMVRMKRKRFQAPIEALWLEIAERPTKRLERDLGSLSLNSLKTETFYGTNETVEGSTRLLFQHLETITSFGVDEARKVDASLKKLHDEKHKSNKEIYMGEHDQVERSLMKPQVHEAFPKNTRFEQMRVRQRGTAKSDTMMELFHIYDIMRVDHAEEYQEKAKREEDIEEARLLHNFLPLFKECLPQVATEIESIVQIPDDEDYVYDVYTLGEDTNMLDAAKADYPVVQVMDDECSWGVSSGSEYDSEDSNAENNPLNDYPEEEDSDSEFERQTESDKLGSGEESENESAKSSENGNMEFGSQCSIDSDDYSSSNHHSC